MGKAVKLSPLYFGAGDEARTRDLNLGKVALYQLSYSRFEAAHFSHRKIYVNKISLNFSKGSSVTELELRAAVAETSRQTVAERLNRGSSGNVSARCGNGFLVTPSGLPSDAIRPEQVVAVDMAGQATGDLPPSSEWRIHRDIYAARPEANAVVHVHSPFAVSLACLRRAIPPFHYMVAVAGGANIRCADYAIFGSQDLSDHVLAALDGRRACLMANHGLVAVGRTLDLALALAIEVESLSEQYWRASLMGEPVLLSEAEMAEALAKFAHYGMR
jgi:L-fuculose-phosphate aldolase